MKAVQVVKPGELHVIDMEKPRIDPVNNVLIKISASGICGSDVGIYQGTNAAATYPRVIGHEIVGYVVEVGEGATKVKVGDRVIVDQVVPCGHCYAARAAPMSAATCACAVSILTAAIVSTWLCQTRTAIWCLIC